MDMPWTEILGGATGGRAVLIVAALFLGKAFVRELAASTVKKMKRERK
jgi:hypothetical protein